MNKSIIHAVMMKSIINAAQCWYRANLSGLLQSTEQFLYVSIL